MLKRIIFSTIFVMILVFISCSDDDSTTAPGSDPLPGFRISEILVYNSWFGDYKLTYDYDKYSRIVEEVYSFSDNNDQWVVTYQYENNSTVLPLSRSIDIPDKGLVFNKMYFTYENGKTKKVLMEQETDGVIERRGEVIFEYDNELLISYSKYDDVSGEMLMVEEGNWLYNGGRLVEHTEIEDYGYTMRWDYTYVDDEISEVIEYDNSGLYMTMVFNHSNGYISNIFHIWPNNTVWKYEYQYENDHLISYFVYSWDNLHGYENKEKREYEYDDNWNLISYTDYYWSSGENQFIPDFKQEMTYEEYQGNYYDIDKALNPSTYYTGFESGELGPELFPNCKGTDDEMFIKFSDK